MITLKIGQKIIFKDNIYGMNNANAPVNTEYLEVIPKFSKNYKQNEKAEMLSKLNFKLTQLNKIYSSYFVKDLPMDMLDKISDYENEFYSMKDKRRSQMSWDFESYNKLKELLKSKGATAISLELSKEEYDNLSPQGYNMILECIKKYKNELYNDLNLPAGGNQKENYNPQPEQRPFNNQNQGEQNTAKKLSIFKQILGNPNMPDDHGYYYLVNNGFNIKKAVEKYFQNSYQLTALTIYFDYSPQIFAKFNRNKKEYSHVLSFSSSIKELFNLVRQDFPKIGEFRIFTLKEEEISVGKGIVCIGALGLLNRSCLKIRLK